MRSLRTSKKPPVIAIASSSPPLTMRSSPGLSVVMNAACWGSTVNSPSAPGAMSRSTPSSE